MQTIYRSEGSASLRRVPVWLVGSTGTAPDTDETGGQPQVCWHARGLTTVNTSGTLSLVSANAGLYHVELTASEVSALGVLSLHYRSATAIANVSFAQVINWDSSDSMRAGLFALPNAAASAAGGLPTFGVSTGQINLSLGSVGLIATTHSGSTVGGINNILAGTYSDVSFSVRAGGIQTSSVGAGSYSGVSVEVKTGGIQTTSVGVGTYSSVTFQGLSNYANISNVTLAAGTHSGATVQGVSNYANISSVTLNIGTHSGATVGVGNIAPASYSGVTIDGVRMLATPAERSIASSLLSTNMGSSRPLQEFFWSTRNKVTVSGLTMTVYLPDDATSAYTASITTGLNAVLTVDGGGRA